MRAALIAIAFPLLAGCVLDWSASWPDARPRPEAEAGVEAGVDRGSEGSPPPVVEFSWVDIAPGDFEMGSPAEVPCRILPGETPLHARLSHAYQLASTETTQLQFIELMGYTNLEAIHPDRPMGKVTWHEATRFCNTLSAREGRRPCYRCVTREKLVCEPEADYVGDQILKCTGYRLPTEAEWEQAYRAGSTGPLYLPVDPVVACSNQNPVASAIGWYAANARGEAHAVAQKKPNAWGLHDLAGNLREWCLDNLVRSDSQVRIALEPVGALASLAALRGGSYLEPAHAMRAAARSPIGRDFFAPNTGFRCARTLPRLFAGVIHKMTMPSKQDEFALDLDGTKPKNTLGSMMALVNTLGLKFQETLDNDLTKGNLIVLLELHADSHLTGTRAIGQVFLGSDPDSDPKNNFTGSTLAIKGNNPAGLSLKGSVLSGTVSLRGTVPFPLPLTLNAPASKVLTLSGARIEATYAGNVTGIIAGGITEKDFDGILIPAVAETLTWAIGANSPLPPGEKAALAAQLDLDNDKQITETELRQSPIFFLIKPDLDLDHDGKLDAYSMAAAFEAVPCTIQR